MQITRRDILKYSGLLLGSIALGHNKGALAAGIYEHNQYLVVGTDKRLCFINLNTNTEASVFVGFKSHKPLQHPKRLSHFWNVQKWGSRAAVVDYSTKSVIQNIESPEDTHFSGHGYYTENGDTIYLTVNNYSNGKGYLTGYDTRTYKKISHNEISRGSIHDCQMQHNDSLLIAYDGLKYTSKSDAPYVTDTTRRLGTRIEQSAILQVNPKNHETIEKYEISDNAQVLGHFGTTKEGCIFALGTLCENSQLTKADIFFMKPASKKFTKLVVPDEVANTLKSEMLSIAIDDNDHHAMITNPTGNTLIFADTLTGEYKKHLTGSSYYNTAYDTNNQKFIVGGDNLISIKPVDFSNQLVTVNNMHVPMNRGKFHGLYNGAHSTIALIEA